MNTSTTLLPALSAPLAPPIDPYWQAVPAASLNRFEILPPSETPMRKLNPVELATIRVSAPTPATITFTEYGEPIEAAMRIAVWHDRGIHLSGWQLAQGLAVFFYPHTAGRTSWKGWELLRAVDATSELHGVVVTLDALALDGSGYRRGVRLRDRTSEVM
ncbi:hypothetical protein ITJ66_07210 [Plantibacter sp. VKM Ac-2885]|uniref:hypothetical protein n=1 Tax=Plantibacter sp. VKM Ac-2885 TaxID=2783828 RepID=UPI00188DBD93|nr:hypothetical protein [Plantibacter sp. VKM Ac-2885]MBF4512276.1 hypothetical protein [Plantibacter sp. VKM Ac-2885]